MECKVPFLSMIKCILCIRLFFFYAAIVISSNGHFLKIILGLWRFRISSFKSIALKYSCGVFLPCGTLKPRRMPTLVLQVC